MIVISIPKNELQDASRIANSLNLANIMLRSVNVFEENIDILFDKKNTSPTDVIVDYKSGMKEFIEGKVLTALVGVTVTLAKENAKVVYNIQYLVSYNLPTVPVPKELKAEMFDSFAKHNGLLNCWPYIRSLVNTLSSDVGLPITLPLLRIQAKVDEQKKDSQKDK